MLRQIDLRYPTLRFECLIAEYDVVALVQQGRAHLGLMAAQDNYPPDVGYSALKEKSELVLCVGRGHPLAALPRDQRAAARGTRIAAQHLRTGQQGRLPGAIDLVGAGLSDAVRNGQPGVWLDRAAALDGAALRRRSAGGTARAGLASAHRVDAVWSMRRALGSAGAWLLQNRGVTRGISAGQRPGARCARRWCAAIRPSSGRPALRTPRGAGATWRNRRCCPGGWHISRSPSQALTSQQVRVMPLAALESIDAQHAPVGAQAIPGGVPSQRGRAQRRSHGP